MITSSPDLSGGNEIQCSDQVITFTAPSGYDAYQWKYKFSPSGSPNNFNGETSNTLSIVAGDLGFGYVYVTMTDNDCTADSNDILFDTWVFQFPAISHDADTDLCFNETSVISSAFAGPSNFRWLRNGSVVQEGPQSFYTVSTAGAYLLEVSYAQCPQQWISSGVEVVFTVTGEEVTIEEVNGTLETTPNGSSYSWFLDGNEIPGATASSYTPTESGNYTVTALFSGVETCSVTSDVYFFQELSVVDQTFDERVFFSNTVAKEGEFLLNNLSSEKLVYTVFDLTGRQVIKDITSDAQISIDAGTWPAGIYLCRSTIGVNSKIVRLVVP
ncbi:hypothetical protein GCM10009117_08320 [Gangjinia marincola]|uniref:Uncharacterized protein n=2 Tax=Gangjinia marincola TaxID=578463 RepID=A0ABN1MEW7_9FLAO